MSNRPRVKLEKPIGQPAGKAPDRIPFNVKDWLKEDWRPVTRRDLWEFMNRMEVGRRMRSTWRSRLRRFGRWLWSKWTTKPVDVEDPLYR